MVLLGRLVHKAHRIELTGGSLRRSRARHLKTAGPKPHRGGILRDAAIAGCYEKVEPLAINDRDLIALLVYATLLAIPEGKAPASVPLNNPGLFPFCLPGKGGEVLQGPTDRFKVVRHGLDEELLTIST